MEDLAEGHERWWVGLLLTVGGLGLFGAIFFIPISMRWLYFAVVPPVLIHVAVIGLLIMVFRRCGKILRRLEGVEETET